MKEPFSFEAGRIVQSTQGRDKGRYFVVTERMEGGFPYTTLFRSKSETGSAGSEKPQA